jgi:hypothetical protein
MWRCVLILGCFAFVGCGPFVAGTWSDDPKNWKRAFEETRPPEGIDVVHSWYMRTPHFTAEYAWFFELRISEAMKKALSSSSELARISASSDSVLHGRISGQRPAWFRPEPLEDFEVYESKAQLRFILFFEKEGSRSFWTRSQ